MELYSTHLNVHNKCTTFYCMLETFSASDPVWKHVLFRPVTNQQNSCDNGYGEKRKKSSFLQLHSAAAAVTLEYFF